MKPLPWSFSTLTEFINCPYAYYRKRVVKDVVEEKKDDHQDWGLWVHQQFEYRQKHPKYQLPEELTIHEPYMKMLSEKPGQVETELKIALNRSLQPCDGRDWDNVWYRGVIDWRKIDGDVATLTDYKTGRPKQAFEQLAMFALHTFIEYPDVRLVDARYYWTVDTTVTRRVWGRDEQPLLWAMFSGDLKQYAQAAKTDTWQKRPSGLCYGWCLVKDCPNWKPKRHK